MIAFLLACAVAPEADTELPVAHQNPLDEAGAYTAGTSDHVFTAPSSGEVLTLQVWYPSEDPAGTPITYDGLWPGGATELVQPACDTTRPVVVFSHGYGGVRWQSPFLMERLASHGYVVVAPDHVGNTFVDDDNWVFPYTALRRPLDVRDSYDWLLSADSPVADCIDPEAGYAAAGHSFGGYTAFTTGGATVATSAYDALCRGNYDCEAWEDWQAENPGETRVDHSDDRVWAVVALAPWDAMVLDEGTDEIEHPTLVIGADGDQTTPMQMVRRLYRGLAITPRHLYRVHDSGHYSFAPLACAVLDGNGCGEGFRSAEEIGELVNDSVLPFLEIHRGNEAAWDYFPPDAEGYTIEEEAL